MKKRNYMRVNISMVLLLLASSPIFAQSKTDAKSSQNEVLAIASPENTNSGSSVDEPEKKIRKPVKYTFENAVLIDNQTVIAPKKKALDFIIQHRFGIIKTNDDLYGLFAPSNIRLGLTYGITNNLSVGLGVTKNKKLYDLQWKYIILKQTTGGGLPFTLAYAGNISRSAMPDAAFMIQSPENKDSTKYESQDRYSYFHELMLARKFNEHLSLQLGFTYSHVNLVDSLMEHNVYGISFIGRYKFSAQSSFLFQLDYPLVTHAVNATHPDNKNLPNLGLGYEVATSGHAFQIFVCTADNINPQQIMIFNRNDFSDKQILLGFNITRLWGF